jgi:hypothetical protein
MDGVTAMVVGPGNLGAMLAEALALEPAVGRLVVAGRRPERCEAVAGQARLIAAIHGRRPEVVAAAPDWSGDGVDLAVLAPTLQSWWVLNELPEAARAPLRGLGLGAWLPFPLAPLIDVMEQLGGDPFSVIVSFPDITGPVLRGMGYDVGCGLGNVSEVAAKFPRPVRLVAHHALGPYAFRSYGAFGGELPPYLVDMPKDEADAVIRMPWRLLTDRDMNRVTAAAAARLFTALLGDGMTLDHVPTPAGLPGGYPVLAGGMRVELDLRWPVEEAIAVNDAGGRFDGVERIDADGTVTLTAETAETLRAVLGYDVPVLRPSDAAGAAAELKRCFERHAAAP